MILADIVTLLTELGPTQQFGPAIHQINDVNACVISHEKVTTFVTTCMQNISGDVGIETLSPTAFDKSEHLTAQARHTRSNCFTKTYSRYSKALPDPPFLSGRCFCDMHYFAYGRGLCQGLGSLPATCVSVSASHRGYKISHLGLRVSACNRVQGLFWPPAPQTSWSA